MPLDFDFNFVAASVLTNVLVSACNVGSTSSLESNGMTGQDHAFTLPNTIANQPPSSPELSNVPTSRSLLTQSYVRVYDTVNKHDITMPYIRRTTMSHQWYDHDILRNI